MVNKQLLSVYGFNFATTLTGCHFLVTATMTAMLSLCGYISPSHVPLWELIKFALAANVSIVGMNVSLMWNNVGFYQIAKLSMIPVSCFLEIVFDKVRYSRATKVSILVVLAGVAVCTVTDVSVNLRGLTAAAIAVWTLGSFELLGHTAPLQAASLLLLGPAVDYWLSGRRIDAYEYSVPSVVSSPGRRPLPKPPNPTSLCLVPSRSGVCIGVSCAIAVGTNLSQFVCIGRFTAVTFQVLGHMKTLLVLLLGFSLFGKEGLNAQVGPPPQGVA
eukprot:jgi/Mesen1/7275/ME000373S06349